MISDARGGHVSPGVYSEEKYVTYSTKSLGLTSLGLVGEAVKGPAFQSFEIKDWNEYVDYFGGTSPEKFIGLDTPKYEMSYIAKEYLKESNNLHVCRVLGLSGYEAKTAYVIKGEISGKTYPIAVLRSKQYATKGAEETECRSKKGNEVWNEYVTDVQVVDYEGVEYTSDCTEISATTNSEYSLKLVYSNDEGKEAINGKFGLLVSWKDGEKSGETRYNVSINDQSIDYIYNVIGMDPIRGNEKIYIESVFDKSILAAMREAMPADSGDTGFTGEIISGSCAYDGADASDYKECFRPAMTPWIVSEVKGNSSESVNVKTLFRFITVSDGNSANFQVKVSIERIRPEEGLFDVCVRDYYDSDYAPVVLEKYSNCSMVEGDSSYIGLKIGTSDGLYEAKSKFIVVEISNEDGIAESVPAGFLGYPVPKYSCDENVLMNYNVLYNSLVKSKRQYFGMADKVVDEDVINYKGAKNYEEGDDELINPEKLTRGFHMDSIFDAMKEKSGLTNENIFVNGVSGYDFDCVAARQDSSYKRIPRINTEAYMDDTIYADMNLRKFAVYFYGGFDGWNIFEKTRSNTDEFRANKYKVDDTSLYQPISGDSDNVYDLNQGLDLNLPKTAITSDYYAYLAGYRQFANPNDIQINLFATPGIDWANNTQLVEEAISVIEDKEDGRGGDALYVITTPMQFEGVEWENEDVLTAQLEDTEIDTSYGATFYPWAKYYDNNAKIYLNMPATRDVVRDMAYTDNKLYPWYSPAGISRGDVDCVKTTKRLTVPGMDSLYEGRINPLATFSKDGVKIWGNKTMTKIDNPVNRINARRLVIRVKELVINASKQLIFEQYDVALEKQFRGLVEPILSDVKEKRGISNFKVVTECTEETRDQHILPAKILVKPIGALEYISITFTIYPESVDFED